MTAERDTRVPMHRYPCTRLKQVVQRQERTACLIVHRLDVCLLSPEHAGDRHAEGEEANAPLQQRQRRRDARVLRAGERRGRAEQAHVQTQTAPGQEPGLPPVRVLQGGEEPLGLRVSHTFLLENISHYEISSLVKGQEQTAHWGAMRRHGRGSRSICSRGIGSLFSLI